MSVPRSPPRVNLEQFRELKISKLSAFTMIAVENKAYIFGGVVGLLSDRRDVLVMNENFEWKKHFQTLRNSRRDFRSVLYTDDKASA